MVFLIRQFSFMINYLNLMVSSLIPIQYSKIFRNITFTPALILVHKYLFLLYQLFGLNLV